MSLSLPNEAEATAESSDASASHTTFQNLAKDPPNSGCTSGSSHVSPNYISNPQKQPHLSPPIHDASDILCGVGSWRPAFLQRCRSIYLFLGIMCCSSTIQTALSVGLVSSQVTTLEKQFGLQSYHAGMTQAFFEVGYVCAVLFVSYYGGRGCMPRWIATGLMVFGLGSLTYALPQFIAASLSDQEVQLDYFCRANGTAPMDVERCNSKYRHHASAKENWYVIVIFICAQFMMGLGASPILSLAPTYIDDHTSADKSPPMIAALHSAAVLGPLFGYALGSMCMRVSANFYEGSADPQAYLDHMDTRFVGAWWLGFVILGLMTFVSAAIISLFPKHLTKKQATSSTVTTTVSTLSSDVTDLPQDSRALLDKPGPSATLPTSFNLENKSLHSKTPTDEKMCQAQDTVKSAPQDSERNMKALPMHLLNLLRNRVFLLTTFGACFECFLIVGFATFAPKYLERQYLFHPIMAAISAGLIVVPLGSFGILFGGILLYRFPMSIKRVAYVILSCILLVVACMSGFFFVGCNDPAIVGYNVDAEGNALLPHIRDEQVNFTQNCSVSCGCSANVWNPYCDSGQQITYFSPCFAGCHNNLTTDDSATLYTNGSLTRNCLCLGTPSASILLPDFHTASEGASSSYSRLVRGMCASQCGSRHVVFLVLLCASLLFMCLTQNPMVMITLRSVPHKERALALGLQLVIMRLCSSIPGPIVFGKVFDVSCAHWKKDCSGGRGDCIISNVPQLSYNVSGLCVSLEFGALLCFCILLATLPKSEKNQEESKTGHETSHAC